MGDFRNNGKKKNLRRYFWELSEELLNRIWSIYRYCINIVYVFLNFFKKLMKEDIKKASWPRRHNEIIKFYLMSSEEFITQCFITADKSNISRHIPTHIVLYIQIIIISSLQVFLHKKSEWQQVSSGLQDHSEYSSWS